MNKIPKLIVLFLAFVSFASCGEDEQMDENFLLVGAWTGVQIDYFENNEFTHSDDYIDQFKMIFNQDGTVSITDIYDGNDEDDEVGNYTLKDNVLTIMLSENPAECYL
ncbi:lipocalin family protein [Sphingobacterium hungaricum]